MALRKLADLSGPNVERRYTPFGARVATQVVDSAPIYMQEYGIQLPENAEIRDLPILAWVLSVGPDCKYVMAGTMVMGKPSVGGCFTLVDGQEAFCCQEPDLAARVWRRREFFSASHVMKALRIPEGREDLAQRLFEEGSEDSIIFEALHRIVLVEVDQASSLIHVPKRADSPMVTGTVLSAGPDCADVKTGDRVARVQKFSAEEEKEIHPLMRLGGKEFEVLDEGELAGIVKDDKDLKALNTKAIVEPDAEVGKIHLPDGAERDCPLTGLVLSAGDQCKQVRTGDRVVRASFRRDDVLRWRGRHIVILDEPEIAGVIDAR